MTRRALVPAAVLIAAAAIAATQGCASSRKTGPATATATCIPCCPRTFSPTAVATAALSISELFADGAGVQWIEVWNRGTSSVPLGGWWLCSYPDYWPFPSSVSLPAGARVVVHWNAAGTDTATDLFTGAGSLASFLTTSGEVGLYVCGTFGSGACIRDYLEWGQAGHVREFAAIGAGIWSADAAVPLSAGQSLTLDPTTPGNRGCHYELRAPSPGT